MLIHRFSIQQVLDLDFFSANARCFVPMDFRLMDRTVSKPYRSDPFPLPPTASSINPSQAVKLSNATTNSKGFDVGNGTDDLELHSL
jgi:hypothetical protein